MNIHSCRTYLEQNANFNNSKICHDYLTWEVKNSNFSEMKQQKHNKLAH
jgi:hypothetical protein